MQIQCSQRMEYGKFFSDFGKIMIRGVLKFDHGFIIYEWKNTEI